MPKRAPPCGGLASLLLLAGSLEARADLTLTWNAIHDTPGSVAALDFDCAATNGSYRLVATFTPSENVPGFTALEAELVVGSLVPLPFPQTPPPLEPFWHFELGGCNEGNLALVRAHGSASHAVGQHGWPSDVVSVLRAGSARTGARSHPRHDGSGIGVPAHGRRGVLRLHARRHDVWCDELRGMLHRVHGVLPGYRWAPQRRRFVPTRLGAEPRERERDRVREHALINMWGHQRSITRVRGDGSGWSGTRHDRVVDDSDPSRLEAPSSCRLARTHVSPCDVAHAERDVGNVEVMIDEHESGSRPLLLKMDAPPRTRASHLKGFFHRSRLPSTRGPSALSCELKPSGTRPPSAPAARTFQRQGLASGWAILRKPAS